MFFCKVCFHVFSTHPSWWQTFHFLTADYISFTTYIYPRHFMVFCALCFAPLFICWPAPDVCLIGHIVFDWRLPAPTTASTTNIVTTQTNNVFQVDHLSLRCCVSTVHRFLFQWHRKCPVNQVHYDNWGHCLTPNSWPRTIYFEKRNKQSLFLPGRWMRCDH